MNDTEPQTAGAKVLCHFAMSLDGYVAGPNHEMDWVFGLSVRPGLVDEYVATTGAVLAGRHGWDAAIDKNRPYGGAWQGPIFVLTHHPEDATPAADVTFLEAKCPAQPSQCWIHIPATRSRFGQRGHRLKQPPELHGLDQVAIESGRLAARVVGRLAVPAQRDQADVRHG